MYATLEERQTNSPLALNALRVHQAIVENGNARAWAALYILSSAASAVDYLIGTVWRLPVSIISLFPLNRTDLPTFKELLICAAKTFFCAIGILIFPIMGLYSPEKTQDFLEYLGLVCIAPQVINVSPAIPPKISITIPTTIKYASDNYVPIETTGPQKVDRLEVPLKKKSSRPIKHPLTVDLTTSDMLLNKHTINIVPDEYQNRNLVNKRDENWDKVSKISTSDIKLIIKNARDGSKAMDISIFPKRWNTTEKGFPFILQKAKINGLYLWQHVADLIHVPSNDRDAADVMKDIIRTLYRLSRKAQPEVENVAAVEPAIVKANSQPNVEKSPQISPRNVLIPKIDMDVWEKLQDIRHEDLINANPADGKWIIPWEGPVFLATHLSEWVEVELLLCLTKTLYKGEPLMDVVARRLNINTNPKTEPTKNKTLQVIEEIIKTVYPTGE